MLELQLNLSKAGKPIEKKLLFSDVQSLIEKECVRCHSQGDNYPHLDSFPFKGRDGVSLASIMEKVKDRINDEKRPMPQEGLLDLNSRQKLTNWIDAGYLTFQPQEGISANLEEYKVIMSWEAASKAGQNIELPSSSQGKYQTSIGKFPAGTVVTINVKVVGPGDVEVFNKKFESIEVPRSGTIYLPLFANAVDTTLPDGDVTILTDDSNGGTQIIEPVDTGLDIQLNLSEAGKPIEKPLLFSDVQNLIEKECVRCHSSGENYPRLDNFPFKGRDGETLAMTMQKINSRIHDTDRPMPKNGLLDIDNCEKLTNWIEAGYLTFQPQQEISAKLEDYKVLMTWKAATEAVHNLELPFSTEGKYQTSIGKFPIGTELTVSIKVIGPYEKEVFNKEFETIKVPTSGTIYLPVFANAVDTIAPVAGQNGDIQINSLSFSGAEISWTSAKDNVTSTDLVRYEIYQIANPSQDSMISVENIRNNSKKVADVTGATNVELKELLALETYALNIIAFDEVGNHVVYKPISFVVPENPAQPVISVYPECLSSSATYREIEAWRNAAARDLNSDVASVVVNDRIKACFQENVPQCVTPVVNYIKRNEVASARWDTTYEQTPQRRPPVEFLAPDAEGYEYIIPPNIMEISEEKGWTAVRYKSRMSGGFDSQTANILMVYVPGEKFDQWLNFSTPAEATSDSDSDFDFVPSPQAPIHPDSFEPGSGAPRVFTMVSLNKATTDKQAEVFFQMFNREDRGPKFSPRENQNISGCVSCHPNGLRAISPLGFHVREGEQVLPEIDWKAVKIMNDAMDAGTGGKTVSWRTANLENTNGETVKRAFYNPESHGPVIGPETPLNNLGTRTEAFIMGGTFTNGESAVGCFNKRTRIELTDIFDRPPGSKNIYSLSENPSIRWKKVSEAMNCASCHNGSKRSSLRGDDSQLWREVEFKILVDQSMPLGAHYNPLDSYNNEAGNVNNPVVDELTADERIALANCLQEEFSLERKELAKWLSQKHCSAE